MKYFLFVLILTTLAFADNYGCTETAAGVIPHSAGSDAITLNLINDWPLANMALGLDIFEYPGNFYILSVDESNDWIQSYNPVSGVPGTNFSLDVGNGSCFGLAWNNNHINSAYYTDDWDNPNLFYTDNFGSTWTTVPNPAGTSGRGMDFDGADYWITNGTGGGIWRFLPGVGEQNITIPEVTAQPSGLTVFPYGSNMGLAVTTYLTHNIYFYEWNGSTMSYIGSAACPASNIALSVGLAYAETNGHIYWSYMDSSGDFHLTEFSFDIVALEHTSWGAIKSSF